MAKDQWKCSCGKQFRTHAAAVGHQAVNNLGSNTHRISKINW